MKLLTALTTLPITLTACSNTQPIETPQTIYVDAGAPLECNKLDEPKDIDGTTATYSCQAPGAYLESVDTTTNTAQHFTTNSQGTQVTHDPTEMTIIDQL